jgi:8-oxo-dGTP pyrophosphatase MutT (NUDIX family)
VSDPVAAPVVPRPAASVVLLRDGESGLETWLMRRVDEMLFAAGMSVFPGGSVDSEDAAAGPELVEMAGQLGCDVVEAGRLVCAAIRETFEEAGVLLATPPVNVNEELRVAVENRHVPFADALGRLGARVDLTGIRPWSRWITPAGGPMRFDTYFFVAAIPDAAVAAAVSTEASHADWIPIPRALEEFARGERPMLPPTIHNLTEVGRYGTAAEVLAAAATRDLSPIESEIRRLDNGSLVAVVKGTHIPLPGARRNGEGRV